VAAGGARAQQSAQVRRIGVLMPFAEDHPVGQARLAAFLQGLQQSGWTDGRNLRIDYRWSAGDADKAPNTRRNWSRLRPMSF
jgi:putative tryptophan/tyrosine transport system substrate-binding protein